MFTSVLSRGDLLVAAPPTLLRQGLLLTLGELWPECPPTFATDPTQLLASLRSHAYRLLIVDSATFARALLPELLLQVYRLRSNLPLLLLTGRRPPVLTLATTTAPLRLLPYHATPAEVSRAAAELLEAAPLATADPRPPVVPPVGFSPRELEVLALVVADYCNKQIADSLSLSVRTVESHRRALLQKAGVRTPVGLTVRALREGWVGA
jgi:DNA-binding NarL/FixJ family response regulator